jgi:hypothetical protein
MSLPARIDMYMGVTNQSLAVFSCVSLPIRSSPGNFGAICGRVSLIPLSGNLVCQIVLQWEFISVSRHTVSCVSICFQYSGNNDSCVLIRALACLLPGMIDSCAQNCLSEMSTHCILLFFFACLNPGKFDWQLW